MAFGHQDTDKWFDRTLRPLLKIVGAQARRVDRIEHNDDIDDRILAEIKEADFAVADLTYARPSAYFEAGYAQRAVPVIYTCRADHLLAPPDSSNRVHFDLQMKNIVPWREPMDPRFRQRMESRLRKVTLPILREKARSVEAVQQVDRFRVLSQANQLAEVSAAIEAAASNLELGQRDERKRLDDWGIVLDPVLTLRTRFHHGWQWQFLYLVVPSLTQRWLNQVRLELNLGKLAPTHDVPGQQPRGVAEFVLLVSLSPVPLHRVRSAFSTWDVVELNPKRFESSTSLPSLKPLARPSKGMSLAKAAHTSTIPWRMRLVVIDPVRSTEQVTQLIRQVVPTLRNLPGDPPPRT
jgi:hypothetical protein